MLKKIHLKNKANLPDTSELISPFRSACCGFVEFVRTELEIEVESVVDELTMVLEQLPI